MSKNQEERRQEERAVPGDLLPLAECAKVDVGLVGAKASRLAQLLNAGFPVPDGFVLTSEAFDRLLAAHGSGSRDPLEAVSKAPIPAETLRSLQAAMAALPDVPLAVRSSGAAEDMPDASFAGQYETTLGVRGEEALVDAVRRCWASVFSGRVDSYRRTRGERSILRMAVLVQRMVEADAAGVAFTANPVSGDRSETLVSAVRGLGERLVSGLATPDEWVIRDHEAICRIAPEGAISAEQSRAVAELAKRVEAHFGSPQDIEWALADGQVFLLQARPVTGLPEDTVKPVPLPVEPPPGFWQREASHAPRPYFPMNRMAFPMRNSAFRQAFEEFGVLLEALEFREIGGWEYTRLVPLGGKDRPTPPAWLFWLLARLDPQMRARIQRSRVAIRSDKPARLIRRWYEDWQPMLAKRIAQLRGVDLPSLSDAELDRHCGHVVALLEEGLKIHFLLHLPLSITLGDLVFTCRDLLGWEEDRVLETLNGLSEKSTEPSRRLAELADMARERPGIRQLLENGNDDTVNRVVEADPEFAAAFAEYLRTYGCRALRYEVADPSLAECPDLVLGLVRSQLMRVYDPASDTSALGEKRAATVAEARAALANRPDKDRMRFERALAQAAQSYPVREDNEFYTISAPLALVRYAALELGRRLADREQIARSDDVFFLELDEARGALKEAGDLRPLVARREGERAWTLANPGPMTYGRDPGPPPPFKALPPETRLTMESLLWYVNRTFAQEETERARARVSAGRLEGIAASPGEHTGPARVIMDETEFHKLQPGDVLVCPITSPVWSVLFPSVGALVTDTGGVLSHPAIIAREYRVPAVVATGRATGVLRDGQVVTVDGSAGTVTVATPSQPATPADIADLSRARR